MPPPDPDDPEANQWTFDVTFAPNAEGYVSDVVFVGSNDPFTPYSYVPVAGVGIPPSPISPTEAIADILDFFEAAVVDGDLVGNGPGQSAEYRIQVVYLMLSGVADLIEDEDYVDAYEKLLVIYEKIDGEPIPADFVAGPARAELAGMVADLLDVLEDELSP